MRQMLTTFQIKRYRGKHGLKTHFNENSYNNIDIGIRGINDNIVTPLCNKTEGFDFKIIRFPHTKSAIFIKVKTTILKETLRIATISSTLDNFKRRISDLKALLYNGYSQELAIASIIKCLYRKKKQIQTKYGFHDYNDRLVKLIKAVIG